MIDTVTGKEFLSSELLMWLWFKTDRGGARFFIDQSPVEVTFDDAMVLEASLAETEQSKLKGGAPSQSPEAYMALQFGKRVSRAKLMLVKGDREWVFTFTAQSFTKSGVKLPALTTREEDSRLAERMMLIEELDATWAAIYKHFLEIRLTPGWEKVRQEMQAWIAAPTAGQEP